MDEEPRTVGPADADDADALRRLGYAQDLLRRMGSFSSFAVSFSIISVLTGCITAYSDALASGGPIAFGLGWPLVGAGTLLVALAMAELASAFPTAGALYHWSALLGGPLLGWSTAAVNIAGQLAIVAAIDVGCAGELAATLGHPGTAATLAWLVPILGSQAVINAVGVRLVALLNDASAVVHVVGVAVLVVALLAFGRAAPARFLLEATTARADGHVGLGFLGGLVLGMFTFTGYDASAHLAEETHDPARKAAFGILSSVIVSTVAGYVLLVALTLAVRDPAALVGDPHAALTILTGALGPAAGRAAMGLALVAMWFCGLASVTSASRTVFAFARDGGLPRVLGTVSPRTRTPLRALLVATAVPALLALAVAPLAAVFDAMAKMATMALYVSYALPIACGLRARAAGTWRRRGPFHLGRLGPAVGVGALAWSAFVLFACALPPNTVPALALGALFLALGLGWRFYVRRRFRGPEVTLAALDPAPAPPHRRGGCA